MTAIAAPPLWDHQEQALTRLLSLPGGILEASLGSGKTRVALEYARRSGSRRALVIIPQGARVQWQEQISKWRPDAKLLDLSTGPVVERDARLQRFDEGIVLVNYDVLIPLPTKRELQARRVKSPIATTLLSTAEAFTCRTIAEWLRADSRSVVIADEVHHLAAPSGKHSKACAFIGAQARRLGMSGTPLPSKPLDAWAILRFAAPGVLPEAYTIFKHRITAPARWGEHQGVEAGKGGLQPFRYTDEGLAWLRERIYSVTFQCDGAPQIPVIDAVRTVTLEPAVMAFYRRYDRQLTAILDGKQYSASGVLDKVMRLQQITGGALPEHTGEEPQPVSSAKRRELEAWMEELPSLEEPAVVFCRFKEDLAAVHLAAANTGRASLEVSGNRKELERWRGGEAAILAAQVQSAGESVELHRAHYACFYSLTRSLGEYRQARGRLPRPDQQSDFCHYTHLIAEHTVDDDVYAGFQRGEDILEAVYQRRKMP